LYNPNIQHHRELKPKPDFRLVQILEEKMDSKLHNFRMLAIFTALFVMSIVLNSCSTLADLDDTEAGKAKISRKSGMLVQAVVNAGSSPQVKVAAPAQGFAPQTRVGFYTGDQWEPAIAADRHGHIYILYPQYFGVPGCPQCASPAMVLQISNDRGKTWGDPHLAYPEGATHDQVDAQIVVDPLDGRTVYAAFMQNLKADIVVGKSTDFGQTWSFVVANHTKAATDKPWLAVRGEDIYVAYNHIQKVWVSHSHDGGQTFTSTVVNQNAKLGFSLAGGGTVTPDSDVYFSWIGYEQHGNAKGPGNLYVSISRDQGSTWISKLLDVSAAPPDCSAYLCGWAYLSAQLALTSDSAGNLYALWNANETDGGPARLYFASSQDGGETWSAKMDVTNAPTGVNHTFPAIAAGAAGDVRIAWMDTRENPLWNTYFRNSKDGGISWSSEYDLSTSVSGYDYIYPNGFSFPFGDYFELDIDNKGMTHVVWGEGQNYDSPGSIWYTQGNP
jgi:hypothetical protein